MKKFRLWRINRAYRRIQKLEFKVGEKALDLRFAFTRQTVWLLNNRWKGMGVNRAKRKEVLRQLAAGR